MRRQQQHININADTPKLGMYNYLFLSSRRRRIIHKMMKPQKSPQTS